MADYEWTVPATVVRVVDGDTIEVDLDLGWRVYRNREHIRINGLWSPERNTRKGQRAKAYAESLLPPGATVLVRSETKPTFTRTLGSIQLPNGADFAEVMIAAGHGTPER